MTNDSDDGLIQKHNFVLIKTAQFANTVNKVNKLITVFAWLPVTYKQFPDNIPRHIRSSTLYILTG
jgi:hypothetical protein